MSQFIILLDGMTGAGKSTTSNFLETKIPRMARVSFDRVKNFISDFERGDRDNGIAREITHTMTKKYLDLGLSVLIEHSFKNEEEIRSYEALAQNKNIPCFKFQLYCDPNESFKRVVDRQKDRDNKVPEERIIRNISLYTDRGDLGFTSINTTNKDLDHVAKIILEQVNFL